MQTGKQLRNIINVYSCQWRNRDKGHKKQAKGLSFFQKFLTRLTVLTNTEQEVNCITYSTLTLSRFYI